MAAHDTLDHYLDEIRRVRMTNAGTGETSYYPAIAMLLNSVGERLSPRVYCLHHPSGNAGIPDFGLFEQAQFSRGDGVTWSAGVNPERGVVEVKGATHSIDKLTQSAQVLQQYLPKYQLVLATNLWRFRLLQADGSLAETFDIAPSEPDFWKLVSGPRPDTLRQRFEEFVQRCLLTKAPLRQPSEVAFYLASYARESLSRLNEVADYPALSSLRSSLEQALSIKFDKDDGERLFRSTLVQTLFYGIFSAWVTHARSGKKHYDWRAASWALRVPVISLLFRQIATPEALAPLGLIPLLDGASAALERVDRPAFFKAFSDKGAIQYFYEPFLEHFDPELRRELGVWYTPPEVVKYQVARVDRLLREELQIQDGLADPNVWVLDPCCGTGSYLLEVLSFIETRLAKKGLGDLAVDELKKAAMTRIVGFEIMTAPFIVAHWQIGELLHGATFQPGERAAVYLTNALTDWIEDNEAKPLPGFEALMLERGAAGAVKRDRPVLVVIGNPPYNAYAGLSPKAENGLVDAYKQGLQQLWGMRKFNLDDLYVRFFRIAERRIGEQTGRGIVSFISNWSWLFLPSFVVMRDRLTSEFDQIWIDCLNGDSRETGKLTPEGKPDPSVFSTDRNREGIRVGAAISTLVRKEGSHERTVSAWYKDFWGVRKREDLLASLTAPAADNGYRELKPSAGNRYALRPAQASTSYAGWPSLGDLTRIAPLPGLLEKRGGGLVDLDELALRSRMAGYLDAGRHFEHAADANRALATDRARYVAKTARHRVLEQEGFVPANIRRYCMFAFDMRWAYVTAVRPLWNEPRPQLLHVAPEASGFLVVRPQRIAEPEGYPAYWTTAIGDDYVLHKHAFYVPGVENLSGAPRPNLSALAEAYLSDLGLAADEDAAKMIVAHVLATLYSPVYLNENGDGLRQGWPRIPLPSDPELLARSAALGRRIQQLLDPDVPVPGVTTGNIPDEIARVAVPSTIKGASRDWSLSAWGNRTNAGVTMPLRGRVKAASPPSEAGDESEPSLNIFMNDASYWAGVPERVWQVRVGGYQVLKKWLSYRDASVIKRPLTADEVRHFQETARRLKALSLLSAELDETHQAVAASATAIILNASTAADAGMSATSP